ncbi:hypothetical protein K3495_g7279 [Podosphaera aphanis]|nr:hypothetical protein K3495_g7279 [Podosphaera aphanis]
MGANPVALTRRSEDFPSDTGDERLRQQLQTVLKPHNLDPEISRHLLLQLSSAPLDPPAVTEVINNLIAKGYQDDSTLLEYINIVRGPGPYQSKHLDLSRCSLRNGRLYFDDLIYVPDVPDLKLILLKNCHDHPSGGHYGRNKVFAELSRDYWWPNMLKQITQYTNNCHTCKRITPSRLKYQGLLKQLPVPERRWRDISVYFIGPLPISDGKNCIMVVCCRLTKARRFIPCQTTIDAVETTDLFFQHVWKHHGFPESIVLDRGPQFVAKFCHSVCERTGSKVLLSTAWHPETDGQTERSNSSLECYLRAYCNYQQDDWVHWLPSAEFNANNTESDTTKVTPFFANTAQHPRFAITPPRNTRPHSALDYQKQKLTNNFVNQMVDLNKFLDENMKVSQAFYEIHANRHRSTPPAYRVGDKVFVNSKNINTKRPCQKLDWKNLGPFEVSQVINSHSYKLALSEDLKSIHPIFHTSLLRPDPNNPFLGQSIEPNPPIEIDDCGQELFEVDAIVGSRRTKQYGFQYKIKYTGKFDTTWQPLSDCVSGSLSEALNNYHREKPRRVKPTAKEISMAIKQSQSSALDDPNLD